MDYESFRTKIIPGTTYVVCPVRAFDMDEGWDDEMDDMVGIPLVVESISGKGVMLSHQDGEMYLFGHRFVDLVANVNKVRIILNDFKFLISERVNTYVLRGIILEEDLNILSKINGITLREKTIRITSAQLKQIQDRCPRVIGAMLSNNIMQRVY